MNLFKTLILGSSVALLAGGAANAADLAIKAKAVEYVKVCSLYGQGFYYIPGTDTCIKLAGYLRAETGLGTNSLVHGAYNGGAGAHNRLANYYTTRSREDLNFDTRTATEYGVVRTYADMTYSLATGDAAGQLGLYFAFIQFAGFTLGRTVSQFDAPWSNYPGNNFDDLVGGGGDPTGVNQISYTADFGQGVTASISAQDQTFYFQTAAWNTSGASAAGIVGGAYGVNNLGGMVAPDVVGMVRIDQAWGLFQVSVAAHDNHVAYYGTTETTGHPSDKWGWAGQVALSIKNIPTGPGDTLNVQGVFTNGASRYNFPYNVPISFAMYGGTGLGSAYQSIAFAGDPDVVYSGTLAATGTSLQLTTTYGFRGGYTHNWNASWNTALYGAYGAVRFTGVAKALICGSAGMVALGLTGSCNPDFDIAQVGVITRWTPVKNLTFSADLNYTRLDQKFSGTIAAPAVATVAKPAATYELKDQNSLVLLLRAQRNW